MDNLYLSRDDIEAIAIEVTELYKTAKVPQRHLMYSVDLVELADGILLWPMKLRIRSSINVFRKPTELTTGYCVTTAVLAEG